MHKNGLTGKFMAVSKIAPQSTIYQIIKNFKERGSLVAKQAPGCPIKSSKHQDHVLKACLLRHQTTTSAELAQEWQQAGVSTSALTVKWRLLEEGLVSRRAAKKPLVSSKNIRDRPIFCRRYRDWTPEDWDNVMMNPLSDCLGCLEEGLFGEDEVSATISPVSCQQWRIQNILWEQLLPTI